MKNTIILLGLFILTNIACDKKTTPPEENNKVIEPIEPEMVLIDKDLTFTYMESIQRLIVDTSFAMILEPYYIGKYEVTNQEFLQFVLDDGYNNSQYWSSDGWDEKDKNEWEMPLYWEEEDVYWKADSISNREDTPVHGISYYEAAAYCNWLSNKTGKNYRIPTSAQWVRAARGPDPGRMYPWGNEWLQGLANYVETEENRVFLPVNSLPGGKSHDGCFNMIGNVEEFTVPILIQKHESNIMYYHGYDSFIYSDYYDYTTYTYGNIKPYAKYSYHGFRIAKD